MKEDEPTSNAKPAEQTKRTTEPVLEYRGPDTYHRPAPAKFGAGCAVAVLFVLVSIGLLVRPQGGDRYWFGGLVVAVLAYGVHNWAVSGSGRFLGGFLAGALIVLGLGVLLFLAICGRGPYL